MVVRATSSSAPSTGRPRCCPGSSRTPGSELLGRTGSLELGQPVWRALSQATRTKAAGLPVDEKLILQDSFRAPMHRPGPLPALGHEAGGGRARVGARRTRRAARVIHGAALEARVGHSNDQDWSADMRILHTSDWHLNDKLGRHERQPDLCARNEGDRAHPQGGSRGRHAPSPAIPSAIDMRVCRSSARP